jgi:hypothetical protein
MNTQFNPLLPMQAARDVIAERERQITEECRTHAGDDEYCASELIVDK